MRGNRHTRPYRRNPSGGSGGADRCRPYSLPPSPARIQSGHARYRPFRPVAYATTYTTGHTTGRNVTPSQDMTGLRMPRHTQPAEPQQETGGPSRDMMDCVCRNIRNRPRHNKNRRIIATIDDLRMSRHTQPAEPQQELGNHHEIWQVAHALTYTTCHTALSQPGHPALSKKHPNEIAAPVPTIQPSASGYAPGYGWRHSVSPAQGKAWRTHGRDC